MARIPETGVDGLRRLDCPQCKRLQFRFDPSLKGGPIERQCKGCGYLMEVYFNTEAPAFS